MKVLQINNCQLKHTSENANFKGQFIMNETLRLHNITAPIEELDVFVKTLKTIRKVDDNLCFSLQSGQKWYNTMSHGIKGKNYTWCFKLFKQNGNDETTQKQVGNTIFTEEFAPDEDGYSVLENEDYKIVAPSELLVEISNRLNHFYRHTIEDNLKKEIEELTISE